ncbi:MAG: gluconokinase [Candidatus Obscuribacterales bacterium]|nr:gluconokinase [Candidatus Obscuribacterales bacterium]
MIVVITGVSGSGKSSVGRKLAERLGCRFYDADDFHSQSNIDKMTRGEALTDEDRAPWLQSMRKAITHWNDLGESAVLACSALKRSYRETLIGGLNNAVLVYLKAGAETISARLKQRQGHFMKANMLAGQFSTLEEPDDTEAIIVDGAKTIEEIVAKLSSQLKAAKSES